MVEKGADGELLLKAEHFPDDTVELFPAIWLYIQTGQWKLAQATLATHIRLQ